MAIETRVPQDVNLSSKPDVQGFGQRMNHRAYQTFPAVLAPLSSPLPLGPRRGSCAVAIFDHPDDVLVTKSASLHHLSPQLENRLTTNRRHLREAGQLVLTTEILSGNKFSPQQEILPILHRIFFVISTSE